MRNCLVLGSGRSGTSMLGGVLHGAGYYMGDTLLPPTDSNPKGYFESDEMNQLNNDLLAAVVPVRPSGPAGFLYPWRLSRGLLWLARVDEGVTIRADERQVEQMRNMTFTQPFCFKDPRFCYTLDAWRPQLGDALFICVFREPGRTVASMRKDVRERYRRERVRGFYLTESNALQAWTLMYRRVLGVHRTKGDWLFVHYDQVLDGSAIPRIESELDATIDGSFVDHSLKRSANIGQLPRDTIEVYRRLCDLAGYA